jgi:multiple sugar transport system permease protein
LSTQLSSPPKKNVVLSNNIIKTLKWIGDHYFVPATIGPALIILLAFVYLPSLYSFFLSFYKTKLFVPVEFVGLKNYISVLKDPIFIKALKNTVFYSIGAILGTIVCGLGLALILDSKVRGKDLFRTAFFIPYILPYAAFALLWYWLFDPRYGLVNYVLNLLSIQAIPWLTSSSWVIPAFILMDIWKRTGFAMVLFLAGLQTIPRELYDSATVDGAGEEAYHFTTTISSDAICSYYVLSAYIPTFHRTICNDERGTQQRLDFVGLLDVSGWVYWS